MNDEGKGQEPDIEDPQDNEPTGETFTAEYVRKLREENARHRQKAREAQEAAERARVEAERAKLDELERLKAEKADAERAAAEAKAEAARARHLVTLADKVVDAEDALAIAERAGLVTEEGVDVDKLLEAKPYLRKPTTGGGAGGANGALRKPQGPNPWARDSLNLTEQARILRENPTLAAELKAAAKE